MVSSKEMLLLSPFALVQFSLKVNDFLRWWHAHMVSCDSKGLGEKKSIWNQTLSERFLRRFEMPKAEDAIFKFEKMIGIGRCLCRNWLWMWATEKEQSTLTILTLTLLSSNYWMKVIPFQRDIWNWKYPSISKTWSQELYQLKTEQFCCETKTKTEPNPESQ
jgi:hypothetical protein